MKPPELTPQAAAKELENVMKRVREAQSTIAAAIEPGMIFVLHEDLIKVAEVIVVYSDYCLFLSQKQRSVPPAGLKGHGGHIHAHAPVHTQKHAGKDPAQNTGDRLF